MRRTRAEADFMLSISYCYPETMTRFPIGMAMLRNLTLQMGNCPHRKYIPGLVEMVRNGTIDPTRVLPETPEPLVSAIDAYKEFDQRKPGWIKVVLEPAAVGA